ncbi:MAG: tyrosine-type recombinase/integrase [archaeon]
MTQTSENLQPIEPRTASKLFIDHKKSDVAKATVANHKFHLDTFLEWCEEHEINNLNELTGRDLQQFRLWRQETGEINTMTLNNVMSSLRVFLKWAGSIEAVESNLYDKVMVPRVDPEDEHADDMLEAETADEILGYYGAFHYASLEPVLFALLWQTGIRLGSARALDVSDVDTDIERVNIRHRPDEGTALKNGTRGERPLAITSELAEVCDDYLTHVRQDVTDEYGREPLFPSRHGRMSIASLRRRIYNITARHSRNEECPDCEGDSGGRCGEAANPHAIRRGEHHTVLAERRSARDCKRADERQPKDPLEALR